MSALQKIAAAVLVMLLAAVGYGLWTTSPASSVRAQRAAAKAPAASAMPVIDQNTFLTAKRLARLATTAEEQSLAQSAVQLADHELDLAFSGAIRHIEAHPPVLSPEAVQIQERLLSAQKEHDAGAPRGRCRCRCQCQWQQACHPGPARSRPVAAGTRAGRSPGSEQRSVAGRRQHESAHPEAAAGARRHPAPCRI